MRSAEVTLDWERSEGVNVSNDLVAEEVDSLFWEAAFPEFQLNGETVKFELKNVSYLGKNRLGARFNLEIACTPPHITDDDLDALDDEEEIYNQLSDAISEVVDGEVVDVDSGISDTASEYDIVFLDAIWDRDHTKQV